MLCIDGWTYNLMTTVHVSEAVATKILNYHMDTNYCTSFFFLEQSQYSYAYEHALFGANLPIPNLSAHGTHTPSLDNLDGAYVAPDENVVINFMEDLQGKQTAAAYDVADEGAVTGFMDCVSASRKQTLDGLTCG